MIDMSSFTGKLQWWTSWNKCIECYVKKYMWIILILFYLNWKDNLGWKLTMYNSSWVRGNNAGGSGNNDQGKLIEKKITV